ncbi:uncharacterized protein [Littorina saxatilis]|uniref:uncharacterized protein n=1 Tax=Littorina saxatilis TaxID=31220 RepID=UPI0038B4A182
MHIKELFYFIWIVFFQASSADDPPKPHFPDCIQWPDVITPRDVIACTCHTDPIDVQLDPSWHWFDPDGKDILNESNSHNCPLPSRLISKDQSGKPFYCVLYLDSDNVSISKPYYPNLAYGPDFANISSVFTYVPKDGSNMTLTCSASKVNPGAKFEWQGQPKGSLVLPGCHCGSDMFCQTLSFQPGTTKDGDVIRCRSVNSAFNSSVADAQYILRFATTKQQMVPLKHFVAAVVTLTLLLLTSLIVMTMHVWAVRKGYRLTCPWFEGTQQAERERLLEPSADNYDSISSAGPMRLRPENPSLQSSDFEEE